MISTQITVHLRLSDHPTQRSWILLEKLPVVQLIKSFPTFYRTRRFITFIRARHWSLPESDQSSPHNPILSKIQFNIILPPTSRSMSRDSVVVIATGYVLDDRGVGVRVPVGSKIFFSTSSRPTLGSTQPPTQWVPGALSPGVKRPGREADHSPPDSAEDLDLYIRSPMRLHGVVLV
jgi:hypothetical protein